jgi:hypothetical protein
MYVGTQNCFTTVNCKIELRAPAREKFSLSPGTDVADDFKRIFAKKNWRKNGVCTQNTASVCIKIYQCYFFRSKMEKNRLFTLGSF